MKICPEYQEEKSSLPERPLTGHLYSWKHYLYMGASISGRRYLVNVKNGGVKSCTDPDGWGVDKAGIKDVTDQYCLTKVE